MEGPWREVAELASSRRTTGCCVGGEWGIWASCSLVLCSLSCTWQPALGNSECKGMCNVSFLTGHGMQIYQTCGQEGTYCLLNVVPGRARKCTGGIGHICNSWGCDGTDTRVPAAPAALRNQATCGNSEDSYSLEGRHTSEQGRGGPRADHR